MMSRRSFLRVVGLAAVTAGLAGCAPSAPDEKDPAPATVTADTPIYDVIEHPLLEGFGHLLFPTTFDVPTRDMTLADLLACLPWYSEVHASTTVDVVNYLLVQCAAGQTVFYDLYSEDEKDVDPTLADTGLFRFAAEGVPQDGRARGGWRAHRVSRVRGTRPRLWARAWHRGGGLDRRRHRLLAGAAMNMTRRTFFSTAALDAFMQEAFARV